MLKMLFGGWGQTGVLVAALVALVAGFAWDQKRITGAVHAARAHDTEQVQELSDKGRAAADAVPDDGDSFRRLRALYPGD